MADRLTVYWQPGCTSCLRTREFLRERGIEFESVNVREDPLAMARLSELGVKTVPVVARGSAFVLAQDIDEVARFVGVAGERDRLPVAILAALIFIVCFTPVPRSSRPGSRACSTVRRR